MYSLRPEVPDALTLSLGVWTDGSISYTASVRVDPRLFAWLVRGAQRRASKTYQIAEGTPPVLVTLVPE